MPYRERLAGVVSDMEHHAVSYTHLDVYKRQDQETKVKANVAAVPTKRGTEGAPVRRAMTHEAVPISPMEAGITIRRIP